MKPSFAAMKSLVLFAAVSAVLALACSKTAPPTADGRFESLVSNFLEQYLALHPESATGLGDHRFDDRMDDYSHEGLLKAIDLRKRYLDSLKSIKVEDLSSDNRVDYDILRQNLEAGIFALDKLRFWENNPQTYNPGGAIYGLVARDFAPLPERMEDVAARLAQIPAILDHARKNLKNPARIHTETAIMQNAGTVSLIKEGLQPFVDSLPADIKAKVDAQRAIAARALEAFGAWMSDTLLPQSKGEFRLGAELYDQKLAYSLDTDLSREEILATAEAELVKTTDELYATALPLYRSMPMNKGAKRPDSTDKAAVIKYVLDRLAESRPTNATIVDQAKATLKECEDFVKQHDLVTVPDEPVEIIVMPEFQRGVAVAYCDSPGALEKNGKTFYAISPTPKDWTPERTESFFKEYNSHMLKNLTVHEAMPGHYLQLVAGNKFKAKTVIRGVFQSGIFAEGWATYTEQVMVAYGFGGPEMKMQQLKMRLRLLINAIIDQKIHTAGMTEKEAMDLMMKKGFQEEGEAAGKWRRACLTSTQLSTYFVGNMMINDLRKRAEAKDGATFNLKKFHDAAISFGTISPKYVGILMELPASEAQANKESGTTVGSK